MTRYDLSIDAIIKAAIEGKDFNYSYTDTSGGVRSVEELTISFREDRHEAREAVWEAYDEITLTLGRLIVKWAKVAGEYNSVDGRAWCETHDVPESVFADAVNRMDTLDYGVTPMHPWYTEAYTDE